MGSTSRTLPAVLVVLTVGCVPSTPADSTNGDLQSLEQAFQAFAELNRALKEGDIEAVDRLYADDFTLTTRAGVVRTKAYRLEWLARGPRYANAEEPKDVSIRLYGNVAVISGRVNARVPRRFMAVWVHEEGMWRQVARQHTVISSESGP